MSKLKFSKLWIIIIFSIIVYSAIILFADANKLSKELVNTKIEFIIISLIIVTISFVLRGYRWHIMLRRINGAISLRESLPIYLSGYAFFLTPGRIGEIIRSKTLEKHYNVPFRRSASTIIAERIYDILGVMLLGSIISFASIHNSVITYITITFVAIVYLLVFQKSFLFNIIQKFKDVKILNNFYPFLTDSIETLSLFLRFKIGGISVILTVISWILESFSVFVILYSFNVQIGMLEIIFIYIISSLIGTATFIPGGIGITDGSIIGMLLAQNLEYSQIILPVIISRILLIWYPFVIGLWFSFKLRKKNN